MFRETVSGADGTYFISAVTPGRYQATFELQGFKKQTVSDVVLEVGKTASLDAQLAVGSIEDAITVTADRQLVDTSSKEIGGNLSSRELVALPSINRNFVGLIAVLPGIVPNVSTDSIGSDAIITNGRESRNNNYLIDGANNFDDVNGGRIGNAGANRARVDSGIPGHHQPVRRRVRTDQRRRRQRGHQGRHQPVARRRIRLRTGRRLDPSGILREEARPREAGHAAAGVRRHVRRTGGAEQGALLPQRRARAAGRGHHDQHPEPAGAELDGNREEPDLEYGRPFRSSDQRQPHLERPLAAGVLAAIQPDHRQRHADCRRRRGRHRSNDHGDDRVSLRQHARQHAEGQLHQGRCGVRQSLLQPERPRSSGLRADARLPDVRRPAEPARAGTRQRRLPDRQHLLLVRPQQEGRSRPQVRGPVPGTRLSPTATTGTSTARSHSRRTTRCSTPPTHGPIPIGSRFASAGRR